MSRVQRPLESAHAPAQQPARDGDGATRGYQFLGPWFRSDEAAAYVRCKSVRAFYDWCRYRHVVRQNGLVAKADLDRARRLKRPPRQMHPASLANLRKRWRHAESVTPETDIRERNSVQSD